MKNNPAIAPLPEELHSLLSEGRVWFGGKVLPKGARQRGGIAAPIILDPPAQQGHPEEASSAAQTVGPVQKTVPQWPATRFGVEEIDSVLPGGELASGVVHEWCLANALECPKKKIWYPPLFLLMGLIGRNLAAMSIHDKAKLFRKPFLGFVGKRCWPTPYLLQRTFDAHFTDESGELEPGGWSWQEHALFLDPEEKPKRLMAALKLLGSPAFAAVIVDGSGLTLTATRRLQLAAHTHQATCFLTRPPWESVKLSATHTRWRVEPLAAGESENNSWTLELYQAKGAATPRHWNIVWRDGDCIRGDDRRANNGGANNRSSSGGTAPSFALAGVGTADGRGDSRTGDAPAAGERDTAVGLLPLAARRA